jgi:hypothetical protein
MPVVCKNKRLPPGRSQAFSDIQSMYDQSYCQKNQESRAAYAREYYKKNREARIRYAKEYQKVNKNKINKRRREYKKERLISDPESVRVARRLARNRSKERKKTYVNEIKAEKGCFSCGIKVVEVLQFHHIDPSEKLSNLSSLVKGNASWDSIKREVEKCSVVCANCHFLIHAEKLSPPE